MKSGINYIKMLRTTAIIVTYSDRFYLLKQVIEACFIEGVSQIIIIDNNSEINSKTQLKAIAEESESRISVLWNDENKGSASAFKQGLEYANEFFKNDFIWLLDDDNKPSHNSLLKLHNYWQTKDKDVSCLLSFRPDRKQYKKAVLSKDPNLVLSKRNSFYGFSITDKLLKPFKKKKKIDLSISSGMVSYAPFGGMFFNISIVDTIGYPDTQFFLYSDDHDWSYRITKRKEKIVLLLDSIVEDIDTSWSVKEIKSNVYQTIKKGNPFRIYYTIRNRMIFEKRYLINNSLIYNFNRILFNTILFVYCGQSENFKIFLLALKHAKSGRLGKTFKNSIN